MNKSIISSTIAAGLMLVVVLSVVPAGVTAQMYYSGYNARPYWNRLPNVTVVQGQSLSVALSATDENGDALSYSMTQGPQGAALHPTSAVFTFTPNYNQLGSFPVTVSVTDNKTQPTLGTFYVNVTTDYGHYVYGGGDSYGYYNQAPYFTTTNSYYIGSTGSSLTFYVTAIDPEGQSVRYSVSGLPAGASFDSNTRQFSWTPVSGQRGTYTLTFTATDGVATSIPFTVSIVVDGGYQTGGGYIVGQPTYTAPVYNSANTYGYSYGYGTNVANYNSYGMSGQPYFTSSPSTVAVAGGTYQYSARAFDPNGQVITYQLTNGPTGAYINPTTGMLAWVVPTTAVNGQSVPFTITATDGYTTPATQNFTLMVQGGSPEVTTITNPSKTIVRYIQTPPAQPTYTAAPTVTTSNAVAYYPTNYNSGAVVVNAGRVVPPSNYSYYGASAYGAMANLPVQAVDISTFNISVRVNSNRQTVVSWDTNKPTKGEVVFGYSSQSRGPDLDRIILNYDFTTGQLSDTGTRHEANLGALDLNRTYYLRVISRADNQTDISREIVFIPMTTQEGKIIINQTEGAASAIGVMGNFLTSGGFLFFLLLIVIGLIIYLIILNRRPAGSQEVQLNLNHDDHA